MNICNRPLFLAVIVGVIPVTTLAGDVPPALPPQVLGQMRGAAANAATTSGHFYDSARQLQVRNLEMGKTLAAILRLRDAARKFAEATASNDWPRPDWLRVCSEHLLNRWMEVEQRFPLLEPTPPVVSWWNHTQADLVALYGVAGAYIGRPAGPVPTALANAQPASEALAQTPPPPPPSAPTGP